MIKPSYPVSPNPTVTFWGAAQAVTGSMHLVEIGDERILLDCGRERTQFGREHSATIRFPFEPASLSAVVVSHAHIDHCGNLPQLVSQGFTGNIYCSPPTRDLLEVMLGRTARIQEDDDRIQRLMNGDEPTDSPLTKVEQMLLQCVSVPYGRSVQISESVQMQLYNAGHILGSAMVSLTAQTTQGEYSLSFTGDIGRSGLPYLHESDPVPKADLLICESTYGGRSHQHIDEMADSISKVVTESANAGGVVLIPAFSLGRTQVVVHFLRQWMAQGKMIKLPIYVDSPQAADIADIHDAYPEHFVDGIADDSLPTVHYVRERDESDALAYHTEPCIIVASGGMCDGGRIIKHLRHRIDDPRAGLVLVSYQAPDSLGHKLQQSRPTVYFHGRTWNKWINVVKVDGFSGHADQKDFMNLLTPLLETTKKIRLVHGEQAQAKALADGLAQLGFTDVAIPHRSQSTSLA